MYEVCVWQEGQGWVGVALYETTKPDAYGLAIGLSEAGEDGEEAMWASVWLDGTCKALYWDGKLKRTV